MRTFERQIEGGWEEVEFEDLKKNDLFRAFESYDEPIDGGATFLCVGDYDATQRPPSVQVRRLDWPTPTESEEAERCDGCIAGYPITGPRSFLGRGIHRYPDGHAFMACEHDIGSDA